MAARDADKKGADLSALSYADVVDFLREHATILDYSTLGRKEQHALSAASLGIVLGVMVKNKKGEMEKVILCTTIWADKPRMREAYTLSEFDWMLVEVNALWWRKHQMLNMKSKRIPFLRTYLRYIRRVNDNRGPKGHEETKKAFEFMLGHIGFDINTSLVWLEYVSFLKTAHAVNPQEELFRMTAVHKAYQKAVLAPIHLVEQI